MFIENFDMSHETWQMETYKLYINHLIVLDVFLDSNTKLTLYQD